jgi:hypothetical protein
MTANPAVHLIENPVAALTDAGWLLMLLAALLLTWWALGRNLIYLIERYQDGWRYLIPLRYAARSVVALVILGVDLWLISAVVYLIA